MSQVVDVTQSDLITAIVKHLRNKLKLSESTCYETMSETHIPTVPRGGDFFVIVSPSEGTYPFDEQAEEQLREVGSIAVTGVNRVNLDRADQDEHVLHAESRGLLEVKRLILKAMVNQTILSGDEGESEGLASRLYAISAAAPVVWRHVAADCDLGAITVRFGIEWDWSLAD